MINDSKISQSILSASSQDSLIKTVKDFKINSLFEIIMGLNDNYAESKVDLGKAWIEKKKYNPKEVLLVGDTTHDYEVSQSIGCDCLLVSNGHQSYERLKNGQLDIVENMQSLGDLFKEARSVWLSESRVSLQSSNNLSQRRY